MDKTFKQQIILIAKPTNEVAEENERRESRRMEGMEGVLLSLSDLFLHLSRFASKKIVTRQANNYLSEKVHAMSCLETFGALLL